MTYSSFQSAAGGGWQVGDALHASQQDRELAKQHAVTRMVTSQEIDVFLPAQEINKLPRRCDYIVSEGSGVFVHAMPAGRDATKRPGNVFSHVVIDHDPILEAAAHPIQWYRSDDLLQPFGHRAVNEAVLRPNLAEPEVANQFGDFFVAWMMVRGMSGEPDQGDRLDVILRMQDLLFEPERLAIVLVDDTDEAARWIAALSSTMPREDAATNLQFSTFLRAAELESFPLGTHPSVVAMPHNQHGDIPPQFAGCVVDPTSPMRSQPQSWWAKETARLIQEGVDEQDIGTRILAAKPELVAEAEPETPAGGPDLEDTIHDILRSTNELRSDLERIDALVQERNAPAAVLDVVDQYVFAGNGLPTNAFHDVVESDWRPVTPVLRSKLEMGRAHLTLYGYLTDLESAAADGKLANTPAPVVDTEQLLSAKYFDEIFDDTVKVERTSRRVLDLLLNHPMRQPEALLPFLEALLTREEEAGSTALLSRVPTRLTDSSGARAQVQELAPKARDYPRVEAVFNALLLQRPTRPNDYDRLPQQHARSVEP